MTQKLPPLVCDDSEFCMSAGSCPPRCLLTGCAPGMSSSVTLPVNVTNTRITLRDCTLTMFASLLLKTLGLYQFLTLELEVLRLPVAQHGLFPQRRASNGIVSVDGGSMGSVLLLRAASGYVSGSPTSMLQEQLTEFGPAPESAPMPVPAPGPEPVRASP